jgi:hypothetical protein
MASAAQVSGSRRALLIAALPIATLSCARGAGEGPADAHALPDAAHDASTKADASAVTIDAPSDAPADAGCPISPGTAPMLDGIDDLAKYPAAQQLSPGAMLGADGAAVTWTDSDLFVTLSSNAFTAAYEPLHVYVETGATLGTPAAANGKEYSGLTPVLPFTPTHVIAVRRVSDAGTGGYNGVFVPSDQWQTRTIALDTATFVSADHRTLSVRVPWSALGGCPIAMRLALHVVHGQAANEWKDLVPSTHTPWQMPGGGYYEIDLTGAQAVAGWTLH